MTVETPEEDDAERFNEELRTVIEQAHRDGVDVERNWVCRSEDGTPDWEVEIVRLEPK